MDQHPARTEVEGAEDADLDEEDAEIPTAEVNETMENPRREVPLLLTLCGQNARRRSREASRPLGGGISGCAICR